MNRSWRALPGLFGSARSLALAIAVSLAGLGVQPALAQTAVLGSDGSDGALNIMTDTIVPLPTDGVFHHTTINIASGATLTFSTPDAFHIGVVLLATGDVVIDGTIDISGEPGTIGLGGAAGPGGSAGTNPVPVSPPLAVLNPSLRVTNRSTGLRLAGGMGATGPINASPVDGGDGGGGALMVISNTEIRGDGAIDAASGGSAGDGTIRLMAPRVNPANLSVTALFLRLDAFLHGGLPLSDNINRPIESGSELNAWPATMPTATITEVAGHAANAAEVLLLPNGESQPYDVTVRVRDCRAREMTVLVAYGYGSTGREVANSSVRVVAPTGDDTVSISVNPASSPYGIHSNRLTAVVHCGASSRP